MKRVAALACIGIFGLTQFASAASYTTNTVGVVNTNNRTILDATGDSISGASTSGSSSAWSSAIGTAFANDTGGVWNFDGPNFALNNTGDSINLNYGISASNTEVLTSGAVAGINQGNGEPTSGGFELGLGGDASTRTFALSTPALLIGLYNGNRGDANRTCYLTVTYQDSTTASTSGANGGAWYFEGLGGTLDNPIVSFSLSQSNFIRYDDLGFVAVPEPTSVSLLAVGAIGLLGRRRRSVK